MTRSAAEKRGYFVVKNRGHDVPNPANASQECAPGFSPGSTSVHPWAQPASSAFAVSARIVVPPSCSKVQWPPALSGRERQEKHGVASTKARPVAVFVLRITLGVGLRTSPR